VSTSAAATLEWLLRPAAREPGIDRKALAGLLVEIARNVGPEVCAEPTGVAPVDPRLEQLRTLLLGREIEILSRLTGVVDDPEQLSAAVAQVLPSALAQAQNDARLGPVLAPTLEKATQSSIRSDPRTLVNILYPLIVPAIRKSIGEAIDQTFQSLNETLKHSLSWRGLRWRWEAWRTGTPFAEVVLRHTLVYQVEHAFLIHHHTGLLIAHVAAPDAASQDPQLVSSMLTAIQDFVRDSFSGDAQQGLDALRLGELRLWSERGPFATLVVVIRGNPPEGLHETLGAVLSRIHEERHQALEAFDGDSSGFADIEAHLAECAALRQQAPRRRGFPWIVLLVALALFAAAGFGAYRWGEHRHLRAIEQGQWADYITRLQTQPGIVITEEGRRDDKFLVAGLRDPLAVDPRQVLRETGIDPARVVSRWVPYQALEPQFVLERLKASLDPPASVTLAVAGSEIVAEGSAPSRWIDRARTAMRMLPAGGPMLDLSRVRNSDEAKLAALREATRSLREAIQAEEIHFNSNEPLPAPGQDAVLDRIAGELKQLASLSSTLHAVPRVSVTGHSDDTGQGTFNLSLSVARAGAVLALLKKRGVDPDLLSVRGAGPLEPLQPGDTEAARSANRRVSFAVGIEDQP